MRFMSDPSILLSSEDRELLLDVRDLLEEVIETLEITSDEEAMEAIREAEADIETGKVRDYEDFKKELIDAGELPPQSDEDF